MLLVGWRCFTTHNNNTARALFGSRDARHVRHSACTLLDMCATRLARCSARTLLGLHVARRSSCDGARLAQGGDVGGRCISIHGTLRLRHHHSVNAARNACPFGALSTWPPGITRCRPRTQWNLRRTLRFSVHPGIFGALGNLRCTRESSVRVLTISRMENG